MSDDVKIYICAHRDFDEYPNDPHYEILCGQNELKNSYKLNVVEEIPNKYTPLQRCLNETTRYYHIWKNVDYLKHKYLGFCQYRRYWEFYDIIPDMDLEFNLSDILTLNPIIYNVKNHYNLHHNIEDYILIRDIIKDKFGLTEVDLFNCESYLLRCNMFIIRSEEFDSYCQFVFGVLDEWLQLKGFKTCEDIHNYVQENWNKYNKNNATIDYQERLPAFLMERISNIWIQHNHKKIGFKNLIEKNNKIYWENNTYWKKPIYTSKRKNITF